MEQRDEQLSTRDLAGDDRSREAAAEEEGRTPDEGMTATAEHDPATPPDEAIAGDAPEGDAPERDAPASTAELSDDGAGGAEALLPRDENTRYQERWEEIQTGFVDEPRQTVEQ
jgi:hypothetical protein